MAHKQTVLILGASGRFGRNGVKAFKAAGWNIRLFDRKTDNLERAATGADVILNGWNPAYTAWAKQVPLLTNQVIKAAKSSGATVILPGNVYNFGLNAPQDFSAQTPQMALNQLGRIRIEMEASYRRSGVQTIILRAGDFLDTTASGNWFDLIMTKKLAKGVFEYPGNPDIPHAWAYLPDLARACVELAENRAALASFEDIPFPGYTLSGAEMHQAVQTSIGRAITLKKMSWAPIRLLSPFWKMARRLLEMRYLWNKPHHLQADKFNRLLPGFKMTPLNQAMTLALSTQIHPDQAVARGQITV